MWTVTWPKQFLAERNGLLLLLLLLLLLPLHLDRANATGVTLELQWLCACMTCSRGWIT